MGASKCAMRSWTPAMRVAVVLLVIHAPGASARGLDADPQGVAALPEPVLVARSVAELALVCSGRVGLSYAINGVTGRWQVSSSSDGDSWAVTLKGEVPTGTPPVPLGDALRALADADSSGSASLVEIGRLHRLLYFGYIREHYRGSQGLDREGLMEATGLDPAALAAMQADHAELVAQAARRGLAWPGGE